MKPEDKIRDALKKSAPSMPEDASKRFDMVLEDLPRRERTYGRRRVGRQVFVGFATAFVLVFFLLPNASADVSYAMQELPVIGGVIRITTIYKKQAENENHFEDVKTPQLESIGELKPQTDYINEDVEKLTSQVMEEYEKSVAEMPDAHTGVMIDYEILTNNDRWFTMKLMVYRAAGSSNVEYRFYHIDKEKGNLVTLSDIFSSDYDYVDIFSHEVKVQMRDRMGADANQVYWIYSEADYDWGLDQIQADQNFYFDADGNLVLVFDKYEVAPGYMGTPEFTIPKEMFVDYLK